MDHYFYLSKCLSLTQHRSWKITKNLMTFYLSNIKTYLFIFDLDKSQLVKLREVSTWLREHCLLGSMDNISYHFSHIGLVIDGNCTSCNLGLFKYQDIHNRCEITNCSFNYTLYCGYSHKSITIYHIFPMRIDLSTNLLCFEIFRL